MVKFLIIGDLHGQNPILHTKDFDAIIAPGDFCGDDIRPYIKKWIKARTKLNLGADLDFDDFCSPKKQEILHQKSIKKGRKILEKLNKIGKPVFLVPGNWDPSEVEDGYRNHVLKKKKKDDDWSKLKEGLENLFDVENKKIIFEGITIIGHGSTSAPEPLEEIKGDRELNQRVKFFKKVLKKLSSYLEKSKNPSILLSHNVPYKTKLDLVNSPGTYAHNKHYGSIIAKELVKKYQPLLCVGGHIHEGYGKTRIRKTLCINAGFGGDVNTLVEINKEKGKVVKVEFLGENKQNL